MSTQKRKPSLWQLRTIDEASTHMSRVRLESKLFPRQVQRTAQH